MRAVPSLLSHRHPFSFPLSMRPYRSLLAAFAKEKCFQISDKKNTVGDKCHNLSFYLSDNCVVICGGRLERIMLDRCKMRMNNVSALLMGSCSLDCCVRPAAQRKQLRRGPSGR